MNDDTHDDDQAPGTDEAVGSVSEEAAKLLGALSDWAGEQGSDYAGSASAAAGSFATAARGMGEHVAHGGQDCRYCPLCQVIHVVRNTSPEVREHLSVAASSLIQAAAGLLATRPQEQKPPASMERIDLSSAGADWDSDSHEDPRDGTPLGDGTTTDNEKDEHR